MSDPVTSSDIEDVLSSIRRLVSDETTGTRPDGAAAAKQPAEKLVLTPAQRVEDPAEAKAPEATPGDEAVAADAPLEEAVAVQAAEETTETTEDAPSEVSASEAPGDADLAEEGAQADAEASYALETDTSDTPDAETSDNPDASNLLASGLVTSTISTAIAGTAGANEGEDAVDDAAEADLPSEETATSDEDPAQTAAEAEAPVDAPDPEAAKEHAMQDSSEADEAPSDTSDLADTSEKPDLAGLDEQVLRELIADVVRTELPDVMGKEVTRKIKAYVRREILRSLAARDLE